MASGHSDMSVTNHYGSELVIALLTGTIIYNTLIATADLHITHPSLRLRHGRRNVINDIEQNNFGVVLPSLTIYNVVAWIIFKHRQFL